MLYDILSKQKHIIFIKIKNPKNRLMHGHILDDLHPIFLLIFLKIQYILIQNLHILPCPFLNLKNLLKILQNKHYIDHNVFQKSLKPKQNLILLN
jgi:hypothetical protein